MKTRTLIVVVLMLALPLLSYAVEIKNLTMGQHEGRAFVRFDLSGELGEKEADVTITLIRNGKSYDAASLALSGDVGTKRIVGPGKMVFWDVLHDFPGGFEEEVSWEVKAEESNTLTDSFSGINFKFVKGGCFQMGDTFGDSDKLGDNYKDEKPVHEVCLDDFWMGKYEVTQGEYQKVMGSNPSHFAQCGSNCPVEQVTWDNAQAFIKNLNGLTNKNYRLPTEAEWEYAARGGNKKVRFGTGGDTISANIANFDARVDYKQPYSEVGEWRQKTMPVGSFRPNALGLYDMAGNVWEWCSDCYSANYYASSPRKNPQGPSCSDNRVLRGGSWYNEPENLRASNRLRTTPVHGTIGFGFRLFLSSQ